MRHKSEEFYKKRCKNCFISSNSSDLCFSWSLLKFETTKVMLCWFTGHILGLLLIWGKKFKRSPRGLVGISALAGFNKGFMGFGPVIVSGQVVWNHEVRPSVSIGDIAEIPVCIVGLLSFILLGGLFFMEIYLIVTIPAAIASIIGPFITAKLGCFLWC